MLLYFMCQFSMLSYNLLDCWAIRSSWDINAAHWFPRAARCAQHFSWLRVGILVSRRKRHSDFTCMLISSLSDVYDWSGPSWPKEAHSIILLLCCPGSRSPAKICSVHWMRQASCGKMILQPSMIKECHSAQWTTAVSSLQFRYRVNNNCNFFNVRYVLLLECLRKKRSVPTSCCHIILQECWSL